jgi:hypothetical protein
MSVLNWRQVLTEHGVQYVDKGANVKRGELNIQCPFCGSADPSHHLGLNLESGFWSCWRNREHRGKSPLRLLVKLLGVSYYQARTIAGLREDYVDPDGFSAMVARLMQRDGVDKVEHVRQEFLQFPPEFKELLDAPDRFYNYLRDERGFGPVGTRALSQSYGVQFCAKGPFRERVIFPYHLDEHLVAWTGRAVAPTTVRYRDLYRDACLVAPKDTLFNLDCRLEGGAALVVVEGPLDALKLDVFGRAFGVRAVALSTNSITDAQVYLLEESAPAFTRVYVMMDMASQLGVVDSMRLKQEIRSVKNVAIIPVPYGRKDAAELTPRQVEFFCAEILDSTQ